MRKVLRLKNFNCILNEPYPKAESMTKSKELSDRLTALASGKDGELTATIQYTYQHIALPPKFAYAADVLECISITEMKDIKSNGFMFESGDFGAKLYDFDAIYKKEKYDFL